MYSRYTWLWAKSHCLIWSSLIITMATISVRRKLITWWAVEIAMHFVILLVTWWAVETAMHLCYFVGNLMSAWKCNAPLLFCRKRLVVAFITIFLLFPFICGDSSLSSFKFPGNPVSVICHISQFVNVHMVEGLRKTSRLEMPWPSSMQ